MVVRDTAGLVVPLGLPLLILVMNGLGSGGEEEIPGTGGRTVFDVYVLPLTLTVVVAMVGVVNLPSFLAHHRRSGVLRRLGVTPAHPVMVLVAQAVVGVIQALLGVAVAIGVAVTVFDATPPAAPLRAVALLVPVLAALYAVGTLVAAIAPTTNAAVAIGLVLFLGMGAGGGMFGPRENLPDALATVGEFLPFGASVEVLGAAWVGTPVAAGHLFALLGGTVLAGAVAARFFRWS
ncbi:ABC transporter permease [Streptomyces alkaliphilus]|uniref:ABC transporter permease n=2 Tax=Streptomyces alkaliphilus TaxID=1472722 RepID=A0A7W3Y202_9ACTN|nr:ABC transporter permease [Streptomyces alkaliphilus]